MGQYEKINEAYKKVIISEISMFDGKKPRDWDDLQKFMQNRCNQIMDALRYNEDKFLADVLSTFQKEIKWILKGF